MSKNRNIKKPSKKKPEAVHSPFEVRNIDYWQAMGQIHFSQGYEKLNNYLECLLKWRRWLKQMYKIHSFLVQDRSVWKFINSKLKCAVQERRNVHAHCVSNVQSHQIINILCSIIVIWNWYYWCCDSSFGEGDWPGGILMIECYICSSPDFNLLC